MAGSSGERRSTFTAKVQETDGTYVIEIPDHRIEEDLIPRDSAVRIAIAAQSDQPPDSRASVSTEDSRAQSAQSGSEPPVEEGDLETVHIESIGSKGDGIAKIADGYVLVVPDTEPGEEVVVRIDTVQKNVAFTSVVKRVE